MIKMVKGKWRPDRDMVWILAGSVSVKDWPLHWVLGKSQTYYPEHIPVYGRREGLLLSCCGFWLFLDRLIGGQGW